MGSKVYIIWAHIILYNDNTFFLLSKIGGIILLINQLRNVVLFLQ